MREGDGPLQIASARQRALIALLALDEASRRLGSCCRVWSLDVEDGGTNPADADGDACAAIGGDRLSVD